jgi:hypothetical protein
MRNISLVVGALVLASGCASHPAPSVTAAGVERMQCASGQADQVGELIRSTRVLEVQPLYSHILTSNNNSEERVNGAKMLVRPPKGVTAEQMTRALQCHSARLLLGKAQPLPATDDPYWLPDTWVNIDVRPEQGNFAVTISADSVHDNLQVFGRVSRYAEQHMIANDPELP